MVPNIAILNYADVLRRFMANRSAGLADLDHGVQECVKARTVYRQPVIQESEHTQNPLGPAQSVLRRRRGGAGRSFPRDRGRWR